MANRYHQNDQTLVLYIADYAVIRYLQKLVKEDVGGEEFKSQRSHSRLDLGCGTHGGGGDVAVDATSQS